MQKRFNFYRNLVDYYGLLTILLMIIPLYFDDKLIAFIMIVMLYPFFIQTHPWLCKRLYKWFDNNLRAEIAIIVDKNNHKETIIFDEDLVFDFKTPMGLIKRFVSEKVTFEVLITHDGKYDYHVEVISYLIDPNITRLVEIKMNLCGYLYILPIKSFRK